MTGPGEPGRGTALATVSRAVRDALAVARPGPYVVACSGGADSLALAAATTRVAPPGAVRAVVVDHRLQAGSAEQAVRAAAALRGPAVGLDPEAVVVETVDVTGAGGPEAAARRARREALRAVAAQAGSAAILLGHTLDDQAETVLLGLGRGSGARSLAGMAPWDPPWLRPLLGLRRATTRAACTEAGLAPWDDPHNHDPRFTRSRLRAEVLPLLEDVLAGGVAEALARTASQLAADDAALSALAADLAAVAAGPDGTLDAEALSAHPAALRRRVLRGWLLGSGVAELSDGHLRAVDALVGAWRGQGPPALPGGLEVVRRHGRLSVRPGGGRGCAREPEGGTGGSLQPADDPVRSARPVYDGDISSVLITAEQIEDKVAELAEVIAADYGGAPADAARRTTSTGERSSTHGGTSDLVLVGVLKGAVMFMTDLARALPMPTQLEFMAVSSYGSATSSSGVVRILKDLDRDISGRRVLIVEDIIDSGLTLSWLRKNLESRGPASLEVVTLLRKPEAAKLDVDVAYVGFDIPAEFVVGFGLDYGERYRDLPYIGTLDPHVYA